MSVARPFTAAALAAVIMTIFAGTAAASRLSGHVSAGTELFMHPPDYPGQERHTAFLTFKPEYYHEWSAASRTFTFTPYLRLDTADTERTHFDVRELYTLSVYDSFEVGVGVRKVFWGVVESQHLVDIINQTDLVESVDGEEKLGAPMVNVSIPSGWGTFDFFIMPYFRERTFPGEGGRLRAPQIVDTGQAAYESSSEEFHPDLAFRWTRSVGDWDLGVSHFWGTGREPELLPGVAPGGGIVLIPYYVLINQTGLEVQRVYGDWLFKLEGIVRSGQGNTFGAWTGGFEYTFVGIGGTKMDLGALAEWSHDTRGTGATNPMEDDLMLGLRLAVNDIGGTEALFGFVQDLDTSARSVFLESSRRFTDNIRATFEVRALFDQPASDIVYYLKDDDFVLLELAYYF